MSATQILSVTELAEKYELKFVGTYKCCGGHVNDQFFDGSNTLIWRKTQYMFKFKKGKQIVQDWTLVSKLADYLEKYYGKNTV